MREKFTFTIESITSYELGKPQHGRITDLPPEQGESVQIEINKQINDSGKIESNSYIEMKEELRQVNKRISTYLRSLII